MQPNSPKAPLPQGPPAYSPGVYNIPTANAIQIRHQDLKMLYVIFVLGKCMFDFPKFYHQYLEGMGAVYVPTVFDAFADVVLLLTACQPQIRDLKYIEVFSHLFRTVYLFVLFAIPLLLFLAQRELLSMFGSERIVSLNYHQITFYRFDLNLLHLERNGNWWLQLLQIELFYAFCALAASTLVYLSKHLAEHLIVQKRRADRLIAV